MSRKEQKTSERSPRGALSTGQSARLCFVTPDTMVNWIKSGVLVAQRTVGGQYRIRVPDLRAFMISQGMSTEPLDQEYGLRVPCWESRGECAIGETAGVRCEDCIVRFLGALHCYRLMAMKPRVERHDCTDCSYYQRWGETQTDLRWTIQSLPRAEGR